MFFSHSITVDRPALFSHSGVNHRTSHLVLSLLEIRHDVSARLMIDRRWDMGAHARGSSEVADALGCSVQM